MLINTGFTSKPFVSDVLTHQNQHLSLPSVSLDMAGQNENDRTRHFGRPSPAAPNLCILGNTMMHLFNYGLQGPQTITNAIYGNFSAPKAQEVLVTRGSRILELLHPDENTGRMVSISKTDAFGIIRDMKAFRHGGGTQDYVALSSDSGKISILQFNSTKRGFDIVHEETYGKTGCRRAVPGQYLAIDPAGRAIMVGAIEKQKFVYLLNRDAQGKLTISSPLEAHKSGSIVYSMVGLDVGNEHPMFACLEAAYDANEDLKVDASTGLPLEVKKDLVIYELDLGLNTVTRKLAISVDSGATSLVRVPGGTKGPGGVLVCAQNSVFYHGLEGQVLRCPLPRRMRADDVREDVMIIASAVHAQRNRFFFFLQSEKGDIFRGTMAVTATQSADDDEAAVLEAADLQLQYFDTVPPATALCVLRTGYLFSASELGSSFLFRFTSLGDDDEGVALCSAVATAADESAGEVYFNPRSLRNMEPIDELDSGAPYMDAKVADLAGEMNPQVYVASGRGNRANLRALRHGTSVTELVQTPLDAVPVNLFSVRESFSSTHHSLMVVTYANSTIVLRVGESVEEISDSGLLADTTSILVTLFHDDISSSSDTGALLQVHPGGIRLVRPNKPLAEWRAPGKKEVVKCACNGRQLAIALTGGNIVYFEGDQGQLREVGSLTLSNDIASVAIGPVPAGRLRASFLAIGGYDSTVRILSLQPSTLLQRLTVQSLPAAPHSLALFARKSDASSSSSSSTSSSSSSESKSSTTSSSSTGSADVGADQLVLLVGLQNGVLIRNTVDPADGKLSDTRRKFLGTRPVKLAQVRLAGAAAAVAMSSRTWCIYEQSGALQQSPLCYDNLDCAAPFSSAVCDEGLLCASGATLRIITPDHLGGIFGQTLLPLNYTPRKVLVQPSARRVIVLEADDRSLPRAEAESQAEAIRMVIKASAGLIEGTEGDMSTGDNEEDQEKKAAEAEENRRLELFAGRISAPAGQWASCIRLVDAKTMTTSSVLELDGNEAAFCACLAKLNDDQEYLIVGTIRNLMQVPKRTFTCGYIHVYSLASGALELVHKTEVSDVVLSLAAYPQERMVLAGVGNSLRLYDLGKKKLLLKSENKLFQSGVSQIAVAADGSSRIYVGTQANGFAFVTCRSETINTLMPSPMSMSAAPVAPTVARRLEVLAVSATPRYMTSMTVLDLDTVAGADRFGNVFVSRLSEEAAEAIRNDPSGGARIGKTGEIVRKPPVILTDICAFFVGEAITSLHKTSLMPGGAEVIFYTTISGGLGTLLPLATSRDSQLMLLLEMHMRKYARSIVGRDHLAFRGQYVPVCNTIDGDLCLLYATSLSKSDKEEIATALDMQPNEIVKRLEEMLNRVL